MIPLVDYYLDTDLSKSEKNGVENILILIIGFVPHPRYIPVSLNLNMQLMQLHLN